MNILLATQKPFAPEAVKGIREIVEQAGHVLDTIESYTDVAELHAAARVAHGLIVRSDVVDAPLLDIAENLKVIVRAGAGYDTIDRDACTARDVVVMNTPGQNANAVAELALGLMIFAARNFFQPGTGTELAGKKLGLQAYGNVGRLVAKHAQGFGMEVHAFDPYVEDAKIEEDKVTPVKTLDELYSTCNYVSLHIPAVPETIGSIGRQLISQMPLNGVLLNTARKEIMNEAELAEVLTARPDLRYVTDVRPDNYEELLRQFPGQVFATPKKMGAETFEANVNAGLAAANQVVEFLATGSAPAPFKVN